MKAFIVEKKMAGSFQNQSIIQEDIEYMKEYMSSLANICGLL